MEHLFNNLGVILAVSWPVILSILTFYMIPYKDRLYLAWRLVFDIPGSSWISMFWWFPLLWFIPNHSDEIYFFDIDQIVPELFIDDIIDFSNSNSRKEYKE